MIAHGGRRQPEEPAMAATDKAENTGEKVKDAFKK